jgi:aminoglycoside phosphotransferase (APT) family kinase protein
MANQGPPSYLRVLAHNQAEAQALLERAMNAHVEAIERAPQAASHAVYFAKMTDGRNVVIRIAVRADHNFQQELWIHEQCDARGVPVPRILDSRDSPAYLIMERIPGISAYSASLNEEQRRIVLEELGRYLSIIHSISVAGFGPLERRLGSFVGRYDSLWDYVYQDVEHRLSRLPDHVLPEPDAQSVRELVLESRQALNAPGGVVVHGDYRFKNVVLSEIDLPQVSGIVDFENLVSGDPAMDLSWLSYSDAQGTKDDAAILRGYGLNSSQDDNAFRLRMRIYTIRHALGHLWWEWQLNEKDDMVAVLTRLRDRLNDLLRRSQSRAIPLP